MSKLLTNLSENLPFLCFKIPSSLNNFFDHIFAGITANLCRLTEMDLQVSYVGTSRARLMLFGWSKQRRRAMVGR